MRNRYQVKANVSKKRMKRMWKTLKYNRQQGFISN